jgi:hypothetical protein
MAAADPYRPPSKGRAMTGLPDSLAIALSLVAAVWLIGAVALWAEAPGELVVAATFILGLVAGVAEWRAGKAKH